MINSTVFVASLICTIVGMSAGMLIAYTVMENQYRDLTEEIREDVETRCLHTIQENYRKEQTTRKLLLYELGEALDVDVVYLPSFGYITLKQAFEIPEDIIEACIGE